MNIHRFLPIVSSNLFFEGGYWSKKAGRGSTSLKYMWEKPKGGEEMQRSLGRWDFFIFIFSLLAIMVTDTAFRKSNLGIFFKKQHWPYHTDLLVFFFKFRLPPVCDYLNYYYNITNDYWTIPNRNREWGGGYTFWKKTLEFLDLSLYFWKFWTKQSFTFEDSVKIVLHPLEIQRLKTKTHGNSAWFFLNHSWKFHFFSNLPLEFPHDLSSLPLEIPCPQHHPSPSPPSPRAS